MHGASFEGPRECGRSKQDRGQGREFFPQFFARMGGRPGGPRGPRGFGGPGPHRHGGPRGRRARRGDIRVAILLLLAEEPRNGYALMQEVEERSGGVWRPSPGSVYPALSQLEDEGLVRATEEGGRKAFTLTEEGEAHVEAERDQMGTPWETVGEGASSELGELRGAARSLAAATMQVARTGDAGQLRAATAIIEDARRGLYRLLAGDEPAGEEGAVSEG